MSLTLAQLWIIPGSSFLWSAVRSSHIAYVRFLKWVAFHLLCNLCGYFGDKSGALALPPPSSCSYLCDPKPHRQQTAGAPRQDARQTLAARSSSKQQTSRDSGNLFVTNVCARLFISLHTAHIHWMQNSRQQFQCIYLDGSVTITSALRSPMASDVTTNSTRFSRRVSPVQAA